MLVTGNQPMLYLNKVTKGFMGESLPSLSPWSPNQAANVKDRRRASSSQARCAVVGSIFSLGVFRLTRCHVAQRCCLVPATKLAWLRELAKLKGHVEPVCQAEGAQHRNRRAVCTWCDDLVSHDFLLSYNYLGKAG